MFIDQDLLATVKNLAIVANIGIRPTFANSMASPRVEVHLMDLCKDLYGQEMEVAFLGKIRDEVGFSSDEALKAQILKDIEKAKQLHLQ